MFIRTASEDSSGTPELSRGTRALPGPCVVPDFVARRARNLQLPAAAFTTVKSVGRRLSEMRSVSGVGGGVGKHGVNGRGQWLEADDSGEHRFVADRVLENE